MNDSFYLSNVVPQNYENNAGFWNRLEMYCRELVSQQYLSTRNAYILVITITSMCRIVSPDAILSD